MAQYWGGVMIPAAKKIIQQYSIQSVITTGGPFSVFNHVAKLKQALPFIHLVLDLRDPWTPSLARSGFFNRYVLKQSQSIEKKSFAQADLILVTTKAVKEKYSGLYPEASWKFRTLSNGYDKDDFPAIEKRDKAPSFSMVYTGALMKERAKALVLLIGALEELNDEFLNNNFKLYVFGYDYQYPDFPSLKLKQLFDKFVIHKGVVSSKEIFDVIQKHTFCLAINAKNNPDIVVAKIFDYMGMGKKIFRISTIGSFSKILKSKQHYVANHNVESIKDTLLKMKSDFLEGKTDSKIEFPEFDCENLTNELISYLR